MLVHFEGTFNRIKNNDKSVKDIILNKYYKESDFSKKDDSTVISYQSEIETMFKNTGIDSSEFEEIFDKPIGFNQVNGYYIFQINSNDVSHSGTKKFVIVIFTDEKKILESINCTYQHISETLKKEVSVEIDNNSTCCLYPYDKSNKIKYNLDKILELTLNVSSKEISKFTYARNVIFIILFLVSSALIFIFDNAFQSYLINISWGILFFGLTEIVSEYIESKNNKRKIKFNDISEILLKYHSVISLEDEKQHMDNLEKPISIEKVIVHE